MFSRVTKFWKKRRANSKAKLDEQERYFKTYKKAISEIRSTMDPKFYVRMYELSQELFNKTADRVQNVESRANSAMTATSAAMAFLAGVWVFLGSDFMKVNPYLRLLGLALSFLSASCLTYSLYKATKVFGSFKNQVPDPGDLVPTHEEEAHYAFRYGCKLLEYTVGNYKVYNEKTGFLFSSQRWLQYGLLLVLATGILEGAAVQYHKGNEKQSPAAIVRPAASGKHLRSQPATTATPPQVASDH